MSEVQEPEDRRGNVDEPSAGDDLLAGDFVELSFGALVARPVTPAESLPTASPASLPYTQLDPETFERLVAEVVSRRDHRGVQFYGRRGQKQHGLDVVEHEPDGRRSLYQVKRFQVLTSSAIEEAVREYAGDPNPAEQRIFDPHRFVVVTSASFDSDTANVNTLAALREQYQGDLEIEVWGSEALDRMLRDFPRVVFAVFGPAWAKAYCGYEPSPQDLAAPSSMGLVEDPVLVLNLHDVLQEAQEAASTAPARAASLYRTLADTLAAQGFPGHGNILRRAEAAAAEAAGDVTRAFDVTWDLAREQVENDEDVSGGLLHDLARLADADPLLTARAQALVELAQWAERGIDLAASVTALEQVAAGGTASEAWLCCATLEAAIADGLFDFADGTSGVVVATDPRTREWLERLVEVTRLHLSTPDRMLAARIRAAIADALLDAASVPADVELAYGTLIQEAAAGRFLRGGGLVCARAARQFARHGDPERARNLYRQAILASSEAGFFGDVRGALRALFVLDAEVGLVRFAHHKELVDALPNRRMAFDGRNDPMFAAYEAAHNEKLPDAKSDVRRALRRAILSGHLLDEQTAHRVFGDVLATAQYGSTSVHQYVLGGDGKRAAQGARTLGETAGVEPFLSMGLRSCRSAALQVIQSQARLTPDGDVPGLVDRLLDEAATLWTAPAFGPRPEIDALGAVAAFGIRIPESAVDRILVLAEPARQKRTGADDAIVRLLTNTFYAASVRRNDVAAVISDMLERDDPPHQLWDIVRGLGDPGEISKTVHALAAKGNGNALVTLAAWRDHSPAMQKASRSACAALLRTSGGGSSVSNTPYLTALMLRALLEVPEQTDFAPSEFTSARTWSPGGILMTVAIVTDGSDPADSPVPVPRADEEDWAAITAAGDSQLLAGEIAQKLATMVEDTESYGGTRVGAAGALIELLPALEPRLCEGLPERLLAVARDPLHSALDQVDLNSDLLSRFKIDLGVGDLPHLSLQCAAAALERVSAGRTLTADEVAIGREIYARCASALASGRSVARAAAAVRALACSAPELRDCAMALIAHPDPRARAQGVSLVELDVSLQVILVTDSAVQVRMALAARANELDPDVVARLVVDQDLAVRRQLLTSLVRSDETNP